MAAPVKPLSEELARAVMTRHQAPRAQWHYEHGLILKALEEVWKRCQDPVLPRFIKTYLDNFVQDDGTIKTYRQDEYNLDQVNPGKNMFFLREHFKEKKYDQALRLLRTQLDTHPRTKAGGFWHKKIYPWQMWLDGLYMQGPFYAQYAVTEGHPQDLDDLVLQFTLVEEKTRDSHTGLLYHAWDESRTQLWANPETGCSPHFWSRAMGWYGMALVDTLDWLPKAHPGHEALQGILGRYAAAVASFQEASTGLWYQVIDQGGREGNYRESSGSSMFVYTLLKGIRQGYLPALPYGAVARNGFNGLKEHMLKTDAQGLPSLQGICSVAGLGGTPYRDGSFGYYISEPVVADDYKGLGPFILACVEMETADHV